MITYKQMQYKQITPGYYPGRVTGVAAMQNRNYDPSKANSSEYSLDIAFQLDIDGSTVEHVQKYVNPLTGGKTLFQQLLDVANIIPDLEGGDVDEQDFVGLEVLVEMGKRKGVNKMTGEEREYDEVKSVSVAQQVKQPASKKVSKPTPKKTTDLIDEEKLPF